MKKQYVFVKKFLFIEPGEALRDRGFEQWELTHDIDDVRYWYNKKEVKAMLEQGYIKPVCTCVCE